jgi:hypothetical protein
MTDGTRILRTVAVPLVLALVFLFFVPKTCQKVVGSRKLRPPVAATPAAPTDTALHIQSESPDAPVSRPLAYPAGLDAQRVQYLIEIDQHFSDPLALRLPKPGTIAIFDTDAAAALVRAGFFEQTDSGYTPTPQATMHLDGMTEAQNAWIIPIAKRKFGRISSVDDLGDGRAKVAFTWQWDPNEAGRAIRSTFELHQGTADFAGGGEHAWDLGGVSVDTEWR